MTPKSPIIESMVKLITYYESLGLKTIAQVGDEELHWEPGLDSNSIAIIVKHIEGNIYSRFTHFLTEDGEKPWRDREGEFEDDNRSKKEVEEAWINAWKFFKDTVEALNDNKLDEIVYIRNEGHTIREAIQRQIAHYAYHVGQMVFIGKILKGKSWKSLSIPKGQSSAFNESKFSIEKSKGHFSDGLT